MELQLSGKAAEIVQEKLALGLYSDAAEFVSEIILRAEEFDKLKLEKLRQALRVGIGQLDRGEGMPLDIERINKKVDEELAAKRNG
jgi:Arc/MetJ-type ribon-helix-helix transcriptional regulator